MTTIFKSLSSTTTNGTTNYSTLSAGNLATVTLNLSGVNENLLPCYLNIDWGDGKTEFFENDIFQKNNISENLFSEIFLNTYTHEYYVSNSTLQTNLTATATVKYVNSDKYTFNVPIKFVDEDYLNFIGDMTLINTTISPNNPDEKIHQFITQVGGYLVEIRTK